MYDNLSQPLFKKASYEVYSQLYGERLEKMKNFGVYYFSDFSIVSNTEHVVFE